MSQANLKQVGGQHYREGGVVLQHWDVVVDHHVGYLEAVATKYVTRWRKKNGLEDLQKAEHYVEKLIEKVRTGDVVQAEGHVPATVISDFIRQYALGRLEGDIVSILFCWNDLGDLEVALRQIQLLIQEAYLRDTGDEE